MFKKMNTPKKNILLKEDKYMKMFQEKINEKKKCNEKVYLSYDKLINLINCWITIHIFHHFFHSFRIHC